MEVLLNRLVAVSSCKENLYPNIVSLCPPKFMQGLGQPFSRRSDPIADCQRSVHLERLERTKDASSLPSLGRHHAQHSSCITHASHISICLQQTNNLKQQIIVILFRRSIRRRSRPQLIATLLHSEIRKAVRSCCAHASF